MPFENPSPFYIQPRPLDYSQTNIAGFNASAIIDVPIDPTAPSEGDILQVKQSIWTPVDSSAVMIRNAPPALYPIGTIDFSDLVFENMPASIEYDTGVFTVQTTGNWLIAASVRAGIGLDINGVRVLTTFSSNTNNISHCVLLSAGDTISIQMLNVSNASGGITIYYLFP
jgi:hypothetical protein